MFCCKKSVDWCSPPLVERGLAYQPRLWIFYAFLPTTKEANMPGFMRCLSVVILCSVTLLPLAGCVGMPYGGYGMPYGGDDEGGGDEIGGFGMMPTFGWGGGWGGFEGWHEGDDD